MADLNNIWRNKSDSQLAAAMTQLKDHSLEAQGVICSEFERRRALAPIELQPNDSDPDTFAKLKLASRGQRLTAQFLDSCIALVPLLAVIGISQVSATAGGILSLAAVLWVLAYLLFADCLRGGQSWGKRILRMAVVSLSTHQPCTAWQSFVRNLTLMFLGIIDWVFIFGRMRQRLGDKLAGTIVIQLDEGDE